MNETMNLDFAASQLIQAQDYLIGRGFSTAVLTALRTRLDLPNGVATIWDVIVFDQATERWTAYTTARLGNTRIWESTEHFDNPIGAYLCAELANWGRS